MPMSSFYLSVVKLQPEAVERRQKVTLVARVRTEEPFDSQADATQRRPGE